DGDGRGRGGGGGVLGAHHVLQLRDTGTAPVQVASGGGRLHRADPQHQDLRPTAVEPTHADGPWIAVTRACRWWPGVAPQKLGTRDGRCAGTRAPRGSSRRGTYGDSGGREEARHLTPPLEPPPFPDLDALAALAPSSDSME